MSNLNIKSKIKYFSFKDQNDFSFLSGDFNPIHVNKEYARRSMPGKLVVHGVNLIFWGLNEFLQFKKKQISITAIDVVFYKFANVNSPIKLNIIQKKNNCIEFQYSSDETISRIELNYKVVANDKFRIKNYIFNKIKPQNTNLNKRIKNQVFKENILLNSKILKKKFSYMNKYLNYNQIIDLASITRFVGMKVPGLNSILYKISLKFNKNISQNINFTINEFDKRFNLVSLSFRGLSFLGKITTLISPVIVKNILNNHKLKITKNQFSRQRALVIGGSKGSGEVVSKILSQGAANILLSFNNGKKDAIKIKKDNKKIKIFPLNIEKELSFKQKNQITKYKPTHLYYFATPKIFAGDAFNFDIKKFNLFNQYYLLGFEKIFQHVDKDKLKVVFSPSSISVNEPTGKLFEYSCSKSAMETYFTYLQSKYSSINFYFPRLPKMRTNQTISVFNEKLKSPFLELFKYIKKIN